MRPLFLALSLPILISHQPSAAPDGAYEKLMDRVLAKAQAELQKTTKLHVVRPWATAWTTTSKYYVVKTTESYAQAKALAKSFDQMAPLIQGLIKPDFTWPNPMPVWIVPDVANYNQIGTAGGADAHSSNYASHFSQGSTGKPVVVLDQPNTQYVKILATHSLVHQFIDRAYPNSQARAWVQEGLCSYFSMYWDWKWGASELARYKKAKALIPIRILLSRNVDSMGSKMDQHFIELGMFFNYMLHYREDTKSTIDGNKVQEGQFADYIRKTLAGKNIADHFIQKLIFRKTRDIEADFRAQKF